MKFSPQTIELIQKTEALQEALDFRTFQLKKSLSHDAKQAIKPFKINDLIIMPNTNKKGYIVGFEFDILNQPLIVIAKQTAKGVKSTKTFAKRLTLSELSSIV